MSDDAINTTKEKGLFGKMNNPSNILPRKFTLDSTLKFRCHPGVSCFTQCCRNIKIILTPFDILRLRQRLNMSAPEFLHTYTQPIFLEKTDLPGVCLKLNDDGRCPFIINAQEGCGVYTDRPSACRYYPVGMANFHEAAQEDQAAEEFYFIVKEPHCKGFEEEATWTIREWRADQGVDERDRMNKGWMEIVMRRKSFGLQASLSEQAKRMFFMATTDLDQFRSFVFESSFLKTYEVDAATVAKIKTDDVALIHFAIEYLASSLFGTADIKIKPEVLKAKIEQVRQNQDAPGKSLEDRAEQEYQELSAERDRMLKAKEKKSNG